MIEKLFKELDVREILLKIVFEDEDFYKRFESSKNMSKRDILMLEIQNSSPEIRSKLFQNLEDVFQKSIEENNLTAITNAILFFDRYRLGLNLQTLINILESSTYPQNVRLKIAFSLSNLVKPNLDYWQELIKNPNNEFLALGLLNKAKHLDPKLSINTFYEYNFNIKLAYVPIKRAIFNLMSTPNDANCFYLIRIIEELEKHENFEKCALILRILELPELIDIKNRIESLKQDYTGVPASASEIEYTYSRLKEMESDSVEKFLSKQLPQSILMAFIILLISNGHTVEKKDLIVIIVQWLEQNFGMNLSVTLKKYSIEYDSVKEIIRVYKKPIKLEPTSIQSQKKYQELNGEFGDMRLIKLQNILKK